MPPPAVPLAGAYRVEPGPFLAGPHPATSRGLQALLAAGVTHVLDLTEEGEGGRAVDDGLEHGHRRFPIADFGCPTMEQVTGILDALDALLAAGALPYLHCRGGRGRTGTVVGCYLVRHGLSGDEALAQVGAWAGPGSPETEAQRALVRGWSAGG